MAQRHCAKRTSLFLLALGTWALALLAGCQSANSTLTAKADRLCPTCDGQMRTMPITGQAFTVHSCPSCRRVSVLDKTARMALERAFDAQAAPTVHQCSLCGTSSRCPRCRREMT